MARIQILPLPEGASDERPPFVLVIDEYLPRRYAIGPDQPGPVDEFAGIAEKIGARAVLAFEETVQIPANDTSAYVTPTMVIRVEGDADSGSADLADQIRHGIERAQAAHYGRTA